MPTMASEGPQPLSKAKPATPTRPMAKAMGIRRKTRIIRIANPISPEDGISYHPGRDYQRVFGWSGPACSEVQNLVRKMKDQSFYLGTDSDLNIIDIQFKRNIPIPEIPRINIPDSNKYVWEVDLERSKGPVNNMVALKRFHS